MKKILIIEDNLEVRENTAELLELSGYEVTTAENGKVGVQKATQSPPDIIICDIMMPVLDGYGVLRVLSNNPKTAHLPFIFLTAKAEKSDFRKGMNLGADDYLTKPFDDLELLDAIELRIKKHEQFGQSGITSAAFVNAEEGHKELLKLVEEQEERIFPKKEVVFDEGSYPKRAYYIESGKIKTIKTNDDGKEYIISLYGEGDFVGVTALLQATHHTETAIALEKTIIKPIPQALFLDLIKENSHVNSYLLHILTDELKEKGEQLLDLAYNSVRKRVADALLRLQKRYHDEEEDIFSMAVPRDDLASLVGTAKETVIRTLSDFKEEKLVAIKGSRITILDEAGLANMFN